MSKQRGYKRSWKNYLLDSSYQLRFTFTILAVAIGLMAPLGWWVSVKATSATEVALTRIDGIACNDALAITPIATPQTPAGTPPEEAIDLLKEEPPEIEGIEEEPPPEPAADGDDAEEPPEADRVRPKISVDIYENELPVIVVDEIVEPAITQEQVDASIASRNTCLAEIDSKREAVVDRQSLITLVMIISAFILLLCLGFYGIMSTHKVAGPLFKVGLYFRKVENNVYDTVYNLRKGDQLVDFYEHFKEAHAGISKMQEEDRDRLRDAIELAKEAKLVEKNPEMASLVVKLEKLLAEKEASLVRK